MVLIPKSIQVDTKKACERRRSSTD